MRLSPLCSAGTHSHAAQTLMNGEAHCQDILAALHIHAVRYMYMGLQRMDDEPYTFLGPPDAWPWESDAEAAAACGH